MSTILLAEDNDMNRDMLRRRLERQGYDVIEAINGEQAINLTLNSRPDLILMDLSMPVVDGWQAIAELKANTDVAEIPIIALTAHAVAEEWDRAREAGCDDVLTKPFEFNELVGTIEEWL